MTEADSGAQEGMKQRLCLQRKAWLAGGISLFLALPVVVSGAPSALLQDGTERQAGRADAVTLQENEALASLIRSSTALIAEAAGRENGLDFEIVVDREVAAPIAWFESPRQAHVTAGMLRVLETVGEWAALLAHLEAMYEQEYGPRAGHKRFRVRTTPPSDSLFRSGSPDLNNRLARRSNEAAIETLNRRRLTMLSEEERVERAMRVDAAAIEILRAGRIGGAALRKLYERLYEAGGGMIEDAGDDGRHLAVRHLAWLAQLPLSDRPLPAGWQALAPEFDRARAAMAAASGEALKPDQQP